MDVFSKIEKGLPDHDGYFSPDQVDEEGLAIFVKRTIPIRKDGHVFVCYLVEKG
mgnify:CR=1 FL=1